MTEIDLQVEGLAINERIDRWLSSKLPDYSRSRLAKLIELGQVKLNGKTITDKKTKVNQGDRLNISILDPMPLTLEPLSIPLNIVYEDDQLLIINKPAGLVVHPSPGHDNDTLVNALLYHCPNLPGIGDVQRPGIVHRLDKDTTGVMVIAKTDYAHQNLQAQIKAKTAHREYVGIVYGAPAQENGIIDLPIGRNPVDRKKMAIVPLEKGGRVAVTHWEIVERLGNYTLMRYILETGRTHQIRVHSSHIGYPIVGDPVYSSGHSVGVNLQGQALHAVKLTLKHPVSGKIIEATAPPPTDFTKLMNVLRARLN